MEVSKASHYIVTQTQAKEFHFVFHPQEVVVEGYVLQSVQRIGVGGDKH